MTCIPFPGGVLTVGGPIFHIEADGRQYAFELPPCQGLFVVDPETFDEAPEPPKAFWDAIDRWQTGGERMDGDRCIVPAWCETCRGAGAVDDPAWSELNSLRKRSKVVITCPDCGGKRVTNQVNEIPAASADSVEVTGKHFPGGRA